MTVIRHMPHAAGSYPIPPAVATLRPCLHPATLSRLFKRAAIGTLFVVLALLPRALPAQTGPPGATVQRTVPVPGNGFIRIFQLTGSLRVEGWDRDSVAVSGTVAMPADGEFTITPGPQGARISLWGPDETRAPPSHLIVRVPRRSQLWVKSQSADIVVTDFEGGLDVVSIGGRIQVTGRPREVYVESMGGAADLVLESRSARVRTGTGAVDIRGRIDDVTVSSVSGAVTAHELTLRQGHFESVDGPIRFSADTVQPAALEFINHSGNIELALPPAARAGIRVNTVSGRFQDEWGVDGKAGFLKKGARLGAQEMSFVLGGEPVAEISVRSFKGTVILRRLLPAARGR